MVLGIAHHSPVAEAFLTDFELGLDHQEEIGVGCGRGDESRKNKRQRNERHIPHDQFGGGSNGSRIEGAHVRPIVHLHARVALQLPRELAVPDVDGDDGCSAAAQQHVGKTTRRSTGVQSPTPLDQRRLVAERIECSRKLVSTTRYVFRIVRFLDEDRLSGIHLASGLEHDLSIKLDAPVLDHLCGSGTGLGKAAAHQLRVDSA